MTVLPWYDPTIEKVIFQDLTPITPIALVANYERIAGQPRPVDTAKAAVECERLAALAAEAEAAVKLLKQRTSEAL